MITKFFLGISIAFLLSSTTTTVYAQPELDPTFGSGGKTTVVFGATASADDLVIQPDDRAVMVSRCFSINLQSVPFCAARIHETGSLDTAFRSFETFFGVYTVFDGTRTGDVDGVAVQSDGKIVAVGLGPGTIEPNIAIVRYNPDGSLDSSFGSNGIVLSDISIGSTDHAKKVLIQPDGRLLIVGTTGAQQFVARYLTSGALDASFGSGGVARAITAGTTANGESIALQADGKILAGGATATSYLITRWNSDGSPDRTWDGDGLLTIGSSSSSDGQGIRSLALQTDGRVVALGHDNVIYRFNSNGSIDTTFDFDGSRQALNNPSCNSHDLMISPGGRITVVGEERVGPGPGSTPKDYLTARYLADGSPDLSYSDDGYLNITIGSNDGAWSVAPDSLGRILIAGRTASGTTQNPWENATFSVARLLAPPGAAVGISGRVTAPDGRAVSGALVSAVGGGGVRWAVTNPFGYYRFLNLQAGGQLYAITVSSKRFAFSSRNALLVDEVTSFDFVVEPREQ